MNNKDFEKLGFKTEYKSDSVSGYGYNEYTLKFTNVVYTILEEDKDVYIIYILVL
jgi:hypothetical protein